MSGGGPTQATETLAARAAEQENRMRNNMNSRGRRGAVMVYTVVALTAVCGIVSLAVDFGHVQQVRSEAQRLAEATARGYLDMVQLDGPAYAVTYAPYLAFPTYNPVDAASGVAPTVTIVLGTWNTTTGVFTAAGTTGVTAVQVTVSRLAANGKGVPLTFGRLVGKPTCDVHATCVAAIVGGQSGSVSVPSTASPYLAGMPAGSTCQTWGDNTSNSTPYQVSSIPVVPGTYITLTNLNGQSSIVPGYVPNAGAAGQTNLVLHHGQNYNSNPNPTFPNPENGVGDAKMPADALTGIFMTDSSPDQNAPPAAVDWTDSAHANKATYSELKNQAPFLIGSGQTTDGTTQQFLVPAGATRLYLGVWDGVCYSNNSGSISGTIAVQQKVMVVQQSQ